MGSSDLILSEEDRKYLDAEEDKVLEKWLAERNKPSLSPVTGAKLYELFLNGVSCQEIVRLNDNQFPLGQVLEARVQFRWDHQRNEHVSKMYAGVRERVEQAYTQSLFFISDMLAATAKYHGDKIKKYLQTGDEELIKGIPVYSMESYKKLVELMLKLTGKDNPQGPKNSAAGTVQILAPGAAIKVDDAKAKELLGTGARNQISGMSEETAEKLLELLEKNGT